MQQLKNRNRQMCNKGYTLIEVAIVMIIAGLIIAPFFTLYGLYEKNLKVKQTEDAITQARAAIADFRSIYGRYPCPARTDLVMGDTDYGYESRDGAGNCDISSGGVVMAPSNKGPTPPDIYIGAIPFRQMNLSEDMVYDGYGNELTYAVTGPLTKDTTFSGDGGGITILDLDMSTPHQMTDPPDSAHFVILSHNKQDDGAISRAGVLVSACNAATPEGENCDVDATFRVGQVQADFDDLLYYNNNDSVEQWQISNTNPQNIHLRRTDSIALLSATTPAPDATFASAEILADPSNNAVLKAEYDSVNMSSGAFLISNICAKSGDPADCFPPSLIGGEIATGGGIDCSPGFLVAIQDSQAGWRNATPPLPPSEICADELWFDCPMGSYVIGIDSGKIVCSIPPPPKCDPTSLALSCGGSDNIDFDVLYNNVWYGYGYSGECHNFPPGVDIDTGTIASFTTLTDVKNYIAGINDGPRNNTPCGPDSSTAQTRDTFQCDATGNPITSPVRTIERVAPGGNMAGYDPTAGNVAETGGALYNPGSPMSKDPGNTQGDHDCWCREDYRVLWDNNCPGGTAGTRFHIQKHTCPQTSHSWKNVYPASGWDTGLCACNPSGPWDEPKSCTSYFGAPGGSLTGNVTLTKQTTCPTGTSGSPLTSVINIDTSQCQCPARPDDYTTQNCPTGSTNDFTFGGQHYVGKAKVFKNTWSCPGGPAPQNASSAADAGSWSGWQLVHTEACTCDSSAYRDWPEACPPGFEGSGKIYREHWDCSTGAYEPPSPSNLISNDCHQCHWIAGSGPSLNTVAAPHQVGDACSSCGASDACFDPVGGGYYNVYSGCQCASN